MTTLRHSIIGIAVLASVIPPQSSWKRWLLWTIVYICLANIPDWPIPGWGHQQLAISHSLWVNSGGCVLFVTIIWKWGPDKRSKVPGLMSGALVWLSHLMLDTLSPLNICDDLKNSLLVYSAGLPKQKKRSKRYYKNQFR